ncbi:hypothetical protein L1277_001104 [Okibacterium sp. HSC-33S16]|uniref:AIPR family protein n=1 Tax=Okibacterium sp. HSC-33S16 TaxID=2910965 RepID=UPI0020A08939|nr:AIPR family protein [Okibacterium sp. HSC-33S16]MCP2031013.1 hypothetical protein [Okibacterium sp. HSC-33S16]
MSELDVFYTDLQNTVRTAASTDQTYTASAFVDEVGRRLADAEEVDALAPGHYEGSAPRTAKKLAMDAYDFGDEEGHVVLALTDYYATDDVQTLTGSAAKRQFGMLEGFLETALSGGFEGHLEESSDAYQVVSELRERRSATFKYRLYLLTNAKLSSTAKAFESTEIDGATVEYHLWDLERFRKVEASSLGREEIDIDLTEWAPDGVPFLKAATESAEVDTYLAVLPGAMLAGIYRKYGGRVLEANVRSFLSVRGNVNKGIRGTILQQPEMFLAYNNGISATATEVRTRELGGLQTLTNLKDLQIVNGGQTTASLFYVDKDEKAADLSSVFVQMKLIVIDQEAAAEVVPKVSRYANTQNRVSEADFFSNHPFHVRMEEKSRRILTPAKAGTHFQTKWYYERTRGQYLNEKAKITAAQAKRFEAENPRGQLITKTDAAKYLVSWNQLPHIVSAGAQKNFLAFAKDVAENWSKDDTRFSDDFYRTLVAKGILFNSVRALVQKSDWYSSGYLANIVTYTMAKVSNLVRGTNGRSDLDFARIWSEQAVPDVLLSAVEPIARGVFSVLTADDRPVVNVTEWAKREKCWDQVRSLNFPLTSDLRKYVIDPEASSANQRESKKEQRVDNGIQAQIDVMNLGPRYWVNLRHFGRTTRSITPKEASVLNFGTGESGRPPSEAQAKLLMQLSERLESEGFVGK